MLQSYSSIKDGVEVSKFMNLPKQWENYEVEVIVIPKRKKEKKLKHSNINEFLKLAEKNRFDLPPDYKFNRNEIYSYLN